MRERVGTAQASLIFARLDDSYLTGQSWRAAVMIP